MAQERPKSAPKREGRRLLLLLGAFLLLLQFTLRANDSLKLKSPVWDETLHLDYGALFLKHGPTFDAKDHPYAYAALLALPMAGFSEPVLDQSGNIATAHPHNLWSARRINLAVAVLGLALMAWLVLGLFGPWVALSFLTLGSLDPAWIAQARFATTDIAHGLGFALVPLLLLRFGKSPSTKELIAIGAAVFLALTTKFSALILLPLIFGSYLFQDESIEKAQRLKKALHHAALVAGTALGLLLLVFEVHALMGKCGFSEGPWQLWSGFQSFLEMRDLDHGNVYMGTYHDNGSVLYFPTLFLSKTPVLILALVLGGFALAEHRQRFKRYWRLFLIPGVYLLISLVSGINSGYRHMTPILPFLWILGAWSLCELAQRANWGRLLSAVIPLLLFLEVAPAHPHYLPFTNHAWGGRDSAHKIAVNAASDWGQDLTTLALYLLQDPPEEPIHLAYFGRTNPRHLGIESVCRPCGGLGYQCPPRQPQTDCASGAKLLAISAACLEGDARKPGNTSGRDECYAWLRNQKPHKVLGGSILIFKDLESAP